MELKNASEESSSLKTILVMHLSNILISSALFNNCKLKSHLIFAQLIVIVYRILTFLHDGSRE
jgi:hypothetical protein